MKRNGCYLSWPRNRTEKLTVRCTIDPNQPEAFTKLQNWSQRCLSLLQQQLDDIKFTHEQILREIWAQVCHNTAALLLCCN